MNFEHFSYVDSVRSVMSEKLSFDAKVWNCKGVFIFDR